MDTTNLPPREDHNAECEALTAKSFYVKAG